MFLSAGVYSEATTQKNTSEKKEFWKITLFTRSKIFKEVYDEVPSW